MTALSDKLDKYSNYKIIIVAHTDLRATDNYNMLLSERIMKRVKDYLIKQVISASVMDGNYKGEKDPIHNCEDCDEEKHQENRRATVIVELPKEI